ncbi:MAG: hypothetical protein H8D56_00695 [Planctomycetes bacterium]|nr:hypothetical protein [Planctomycetota bacterium]MBL7144711.1 hypothetical protein [Phycisphaerae bacterium]
MKSRNNENLKKLLEKFLSSEQAESGVEDIQKAEQILREHPAPEPDNLLIANIKAEIAMRLPAKRTNVFMNIAYRAAYAAAAIMIIAAISLSLFDNDAREPGPVQYASIMPRAIWESEDITTDDANLAIYTIEIEQIEDELRSLQLGEDISNGESSLSELEMELVAINNDFWKE